MAVLRSGLFKKTIVFLEPLKREDFRLSVTSSSRLAVKS